jgi:hypothetical protein
MEPEGSLPYSEVPATCPYPELTRTVLYPEEASHQGKTIRLWVVQNRFFFSREGVVSTSPNPQAGGPPLVGCPRLLIQFIHSYPPYRRPFLHPQPEDAPCRGDRDPLDTDVWSIKKKNIFSNNDRTEGYLKKSFTIHCFDLQWTAYLLCVTRFCEPEKTISRSFFEYGQNLILTEVHWMQFSSAFYNYI